MNRIEGLQQVKQLLSGLKHNQVAYQLYTLIDNRRGEDSYAICQMIALYAWKQEKQLRAEEKEIISDDAGYQ